MMNLQERKEVEIPPIEAISQKLRMIAGPQKFQIKPFSLQVFFHIGNSLV